MQVQQLRPDVESVDRVLDFYGAQKKPLTRNEWLTVLNMISYSCVDDEREPKEIDLSTVPNFEVNTLHGVFLREVFDKDECVPRSCYFKFPDQWQGHDKYTSFECALRFATAIFHLCHGHSLPVFLIPPTQYIAASRFSLKMCIRYMLKSCNQAKDTVSCDRIIEFLTELRMAILSSLDTDTWDDIQRKLSP